jgi:hypothetical protein
MRSLITHQSLRSAITCWSLIILIADAFQPHRQETLRDNPKLRSSILQLNWQKSLSGPRSVCLMSMNSGFSSSSASSEKKNNNNDNLLNSYNDSSNDNDGGDSDLFRMIGGLKENEWGTVDDLDCVPAPDSNLLYKELRTKLSTLEQGIGKRYRTRTRLGFLNIHKQPTDPFDTSNVVGKLYDGQIITATGPSRGDWIVHDGGWSISRFQGFQWLESLQD